MKVLRWLKRQFFIGPFCELKRPTFPTDDELEIRRAVARDLLGEVQPKSLRAPLDYERDVPPV